MQHDKLPWGVIETIDREQRSFIWGDKESKKSWHAIIWNTVCSPKEEGGLGMKNLEFMNDAFILKLMWRIYAEPKALWAQVLLSKYELNGRREDFFRYQPGDSR